MKRYVYSGISMKKIILAFILFVFCNISFASQIMNPNQDGSCKVGYINVLDVCAPSDRLSDLDSLVDSILEFKDPKYAEAKRQLKQYEQHHSKLIQEKSTNNSRVVPLPSSGYLYSRDGKYVACTGNYDFYKTAEKNVCTGGKYDFYKTHKDVVSCGGEYDFYKTHRDSVCAGGEYDFYKTHRDQVACGGQYDFYKTHRGNVCAGGKYASYKQQGDNVACGGLYDGWQDNRDGSKVCVGGKFNGCVHSKDGTYVACGGWSHIYEK